MYEVIVLSIVGALIINKNNCRVYDNIRSMFMMNFNRRIFVIAATVSDSSYLMVKKTNTSIYTSNDALIFEFSRSKGDPFKVFANSQEATPISDPDC